MSVSNELRLGQEFCDAVIRVDGVEFHAHKVILCTCSSYFRALFTHWSTPDCRVFDVPNVSADTMKLIIEFAYTDVVPVTQKNVEELFLAADYFNVMGIIRACCDYMEEHLEPQNCVGIWRFTDLYYAPELNHKAFLFTLDHFEDVAATSEELPLLTAQQLVKVIENDRLNVKQERTVFQAILRWIAYAPEERSRDISLLLCNVRLALMSPQYLAHSVSNNELVKASEECQPILLRTLGAMLDLQTKRFSDSGLYSPLNRPRLPSAILLAIGGWSGDEPTNGIEAYDVRANRWVNVTNDEEAPRAHHGAVFLDGSVYCVGGFDGAELLSSMHKFDLGTRTWQQVAQMHSRRSHVSITVMDGCIYAVGGYNGHNGHNHLGTAERYQPRTNQWTLIASMHGRRSDASCATLHGKLYVCGGYNGTEVLNTAECYNPETNQWTVISSMGSGRCGVGVVAYGDLIFAVGGFDGTTCLQTAETYNPRTNTWRDVPSMHNPRSNFGIAVIDDRIFVAGGFNGFSSCPDVECYDVQANEWSDVRDMEIARSALSCCVVYGLPNLTQYAAPRHASGGRRVMTMSCVVL